MTQYAHIIKKDNAILAIYINEVDTGTELLGAHATGSTVSSIEHGETTHTYELKSGDIVPVTMQDIYDRMNDPDDTTVVIPSE
jgi:hypothetical protein